MKKLNRNQSGFSVIELVLVVVVVALLAGLGYMFYKNHKKARTTTTASSTQSVTPTVTPTTNTFKLASGVVSFQTPKTWTETGVGCIKDANKYASTEYLDSVNLLPGEKLRTIYGDGTEYFYISVCAFSNSKNATPQQWLEDVRVGGLGEGIGNSSDQNSSVPINGNPAYFRKSISSNTQELHYVISAKGKIVYVYARTYETDAKLPGVGDFTKFEPAIKNLVDSVTIN